jgi:hypothetical protein
MSTWEWKQLCPKDHMHVWERSDRSTDLVCTAEPRDTPEPVDAEMAHIISNTEWVRVNSAEWLRELVALAKKGFGADSESSVWAKPVNMDVSKPVTLADIYGNIRNYRDLCKQTGVNPNPFARKRKTSTEDAVTPRISQQQQKAVPTDGT